MIIILTMILTFDMLIMVIVCVPKWNEQDAYLAFSERRFENMLSTNVTLSDAEHLADC